MNPFPPASEARTVGCEVTAIGRVRLPLEALPELRKRPGPVPADRLPSGFLKNADEQSVFALAAVFQALHDHALNPASFRDWAVLAAPRRVGRAAMAEALPRVRAEGAWGMSPHLIPHRSLHSVSGSISCALKIHGPNFGVGDGASEALLAAMSMLDRHRLPGLWLVLTTLDPEPCANPSGQFPAGTFGSALALALIPTAAAGENQSLLRLRLRFDRSAPVPGARRTALDLCRLQTLLDAPFAEPRSAPVQDLGASGRIDLWVEGCTRREPRVDPPHLRTVPHLLAVSRPTASSTEVGS